MNIMRLIYDVMYDGGGSWGSNDSSDYDKSKELLLNVIMNKCNITESDLNNINLVKSKLRESNINEILS